MQLNDSLKDLPRVADGRFACEGHPDRAANKMLAFADRFVMVCAECLEESRRYFKQSGC